MAPKTVLIVGALGVVGRAALERFSGDRDVRTIGLSRRKPDFETSADWMAADLQDPEALRQSFADAGKITHVVYAALHEEAGLVKGWNATTQINANVVMLNNLLDALEASGQEVSHITLLQGTKAYGIHHGTYKIPAKESDPRFIASNFYYDQEDLLRERSHSMGYAFTILRPQIVCGFALGNPMNAVTALGVYAAICREMNQPLRFPGGPACFQEATDADLLARAIDWAGREARAAGETYNITNGDCFSWANIWPLTARHFGVEPGVAHSFSLATVMADKGPVWDRIVAKYGLKPYRYEEIVANWQFMDFTFRHGTTIPQHSIMSTIKARKHGFHDCEDTEEMFDRLFRQLKEARVLP
ncbi:MAG TPA: SDR family oxidoreductase [Tianweitania sediminis]|nr:SDR family oxidoreductase [Tianweitania sediminis]